MALKGAFRRSFSVSPAALRPVWHTGARAHNGRTSTHLPGSPKRQYPSSILHTTEDGA
eukprot:CAMPEP_0180808098 /NCGR_PEP_ID=MMETSP1038_2-20121128/63609_1 /TAXON_ID=632150 /ORGANISM="Azadinium spinosum, Strain 3D9" /LENGTH=57 /DNA_ID=CAMNT_0022849177 /DNA_START=21 /DNA_END=190 /DNA_ORIENTATION=+